MVFEEIHVVLASFTLFCASFIDIRTRKIPNALLLIAVFSHIGFELINRIDGLDGVSYRRGVVALLLAGALILAPVPGRWIVENFGMGDIKLLIYVTWSIGGVINWSTFLLVIGLASLFLGGIQLAFRLRMNRPLPFAPFLAIGSLAGVFL